MHDPTNEAHRSAADRTRRSAPWKLILPLLVLVTAAIWASGRQREPTQSQDGAGQRGADASHGFRERLLGKDSDDTEPERDDNGSGKEQARRAHVIDAPGARAGSVEGEVRSSADGKPIAHAELALEKDGVLVSQLTGAEGHYRFEPAQAGSWRLASVSADAFLPFAPAWGQNTVRFEVLPGKRIAGATLFLEPAINYLGVVLDPAQKPVKDAEISLFSSATDAALMPLQDVFHSDAQGEFHFRAPRDGVLEARHPRVGRGRARVDFAAEVSARVVIVLSDPQAAHKQALDIAGHVLDSDRQPVEGAVVTAEQRAPFEQHDTVLPTFATSDEEGFFRLTPIDPGRYRVLASHGELAPDSVDDVAAGNHDVKLELGLGGRVTGTVSSSQGAPVPSFTVHVWQKLGPIATRLVRSLSVLDADGRFAVQGLPAGSLLLGVEAQGFAPSADLPFAVQEGGSPATLQVVLEQGHRLTGLVLDLASRKPLAGASITLEGRGNTEAAPTRSTTQSDTQGKFVIDGVHAGQVSLFVAARAHHARILGGIPIPAGAPVSVELRATEGDEKPKLELAGLGLVLSARDDALVVGDMAPKGGGAEAGMQIGDGIVAIAGTPVSELGFAGAIAQLRGPENTSILLSVRRKDASELVDMLVFRRLVRM